MTARARRLATLAAAAALLAAFHVAAVAVEMNPVRNGGAWDRLFDPDSYTRLSRVEELARTGAWRDPTLHAGNHPDGFELHWSHLVDALVVVPAKVGALVAPFPDALRVVALLYGPALEVLLLLVLAWGTRRFLGDGGLLLLAALTATLTHVGSEFAPGFVDHHSLQLLLLVAALMALVRAEERPALDGAAGALAAGAVWASTESVLFVVPLAAALVASWILDGGARRASRLVRFGAGLLAGVAVALVVERPPSGWLAVQYDRVSVAQLAVAAAVLVFGGALAFAERVGESGPARRRALVAVAAALPVAAALVLAFPGLRGNPYAATDDIIRTHLLPAVAAERRLLPTDPGSAFDFALGVVPALVALGWCVVRLVRGRVADDGERFRLLLGAVSVGLLTAYTVYVNRGLPFLGAAMLVPWTEAIVALWRRARAVPAPRGALRWAAAAGVALLASAHVVLAGAIAAAWLPLAAFRNVPPCAWDAVAPALRSAPGSGAILTEVFDGPELAFRTGRPVIGSPYHLNGPGVRDTWALLTATPAVEPALLERRDVEWIALCRSIPPDLLRELQRNPLSLGARAMRGQAITGFEPVPLPPELSRQLALYRRILPRAAAR